MNNGIASARMRPAAYRRAADGADPLPVRHRDLLRRLQQRPDPLRRADSRRRRSRRSAPRATTPATTATPSDYTTTNAFPYNLTCTAADQRQPAGARGAAMPRRRTGCSATSPGYGTRREGAVALGYSAGSACRGMMARVPFTRRSLLQAGLIVPAVAIADACSSSKHHALAVAASVASAPARRRPASRRDGPHDARSDAAARAGRQRRLRPAGHRCRRAAPHARSTSEWPPSPAARHGVRRC